MIERTEAVVLRSIDYGETSKILTLYTRSMGKLGVIAKGARSSKSSFGASLQPLSYTEVVYYHKDSRELQILTESSFIHPLHEITKDLQKINVGLRIVELTNNLMFKEEKNVTAFELLVHVLVRLNQTTERPINLWPFFRLRLATLLGFSPHIERDVVQSIPESGGVLNLENGAAAPTEETSGRVVSASRTALRAFAIYARADLDTVMRMEVAPDTYREVERLIRKFLEHHIEHLRPSKSGRVFDQMLDPGRSLPSR
jgi:DNA repair protein RecO (recombination protein O)